MAKSTTGAMESAKLVRRWISLETLNSFYEQLGEEPDYLDFVFDREDECDLEIDQVKERSGFNCTHYYNGEEIVPVDLDVVITDLYLSGQLNLGPNRLTSMLGNPEYGKRELSRSNYPQKFTVESFTMDLRLDDSNGKRTAKVLERIKLEDFAGLWLLVDRNCFAALKELHEWLAEHGKCVASFLFDMYGPFKCFQEILPALLEQMPNLKIIYLVPMLNSTIFDPIEMPSGSYFGRGSICPKLKEINIHEPYLSDPSFLHLFTMMDKGSLEKCGNGPSVSGICKHVKDFYHDHFGITFVGVEDCTMGFFIDNLHHNSYKSSIKYFLRFGHFQV